MILDDFREMGVPYQCPHCYEDVKNENIVGSGEYPFKIGHNVGGKAIVFECPHCFEKSFMHEGNKIEEE